MRRAERLFAEHGVEAVTMRQLAAALGVSPMTPYRYFKDKDAILAAVRARGLRPPRRGAGARLRRRVANDPDARRPRLARPMSTSPSAIPKPTS